MNDIANHIGIVTDLVEEENETRVYVKEDHGEDHNLAFLITNEITSQYYNSDALRGAHYHLIKMELKRLK